MKEIIFSLLILLLTKEYLCEESECVCQALNKFSCDSCVCIPQSLVCDGQPDCKNGKDEEGCDIPKATSHCPADHFTCWNQQCLRLDWVCDGDNDCGDDSDELMCPRKNCTENEFQCNNGNCVLSKWRCDGDDDCRDGSDEHCSHECSPSQFKCTSDGDCIDKSWVCDKEFDCKDNSDEASCGLDTLYCGRHEFTCTQAHRCIPLQKRCDGVNDCNNLEDEIGCSLDQFFCGPNLFTCLKTHKCIPMDQRCDGNNDCDDWEDEISCDIDFHKKNEPRCKEGEFQCDNLCINKEWVCDGQRDCEDFSDELNCTHKQCRSDQFQCKSGYCIDGKLKCNHQIDCSDNSDETDCAHKQCRSDQFQCKSGYCIDGKLKCNHQIDCSDNSDETDCDEYSRCGQSQFHCTSGECIGNQKVCNALTDCKDGSDEKNCHWSVNCEIENGGCSQKCHQTTLGARCSCYHGYMLSDDRKMCVDFDECDMANACSQTCVNLPGSYRCECRQGYILRPDGHGCKAQGTANEKAYLIFANRVDIRRVMPDMSEYDSILQGLENAIALDFHHERAFVYWSDVTLDKIKRAYLNGTGIKEVVAYGLESPGGVAVDWIHNILFWTDSGTSRIEVSDLEGNHRKVLIWENLEKPRAIVAHPGMGTLFWTDWGSTPKIERSSMDGKNRVVIADTSLFWPNGLTLDYEAEKLYWADAKHHVIECANLDGTHRRTVINQGLPHPFALTLFEDELYWTDWHTKSINKANKFTGNDVEMVRNRLHFPMDIHIFHQQRQPKVKNSCGENRGGCSHLCLPNSSSGYTCSCPTGLHLKEDGKQCVTNIESFLLFTTRSDVRRITLGTPDQSDVVIPLSNAVSTMAVDFDADEDTIYWTDSGTKSLSSAKWDGSQQRTVVGASVDSPSGLAIDWINRKLYWTDSEMSFIEVSNMDGSHRSVLIWKGIQKPRDIAVDPTTGYMFWTDWSRPATIARADMSGHNVIVLVSSNLTHPNGLTVDYTDRQSKLYWIDTGNFHVESCELDGTDRKIVFSMDHPRPFGFTVFQNKFYWADWLRKTIMTSDMSGNNQKVLQSNMANVMDLTVFNRNRPHMAGSPCDHSGGCSHLCLLTPNNHHRCACPTGVLLRKDGRTCEPEMRNFLIFAQRTDIRKISLDVDYYAGVSTQLQGLKNAIAVSMDTVEGKVYWTDTVLDKIRRANLDGKEIEDVISNGLDTPDGMVVEEIGRKIYWTDTGLNRIEVANLDGSMRKVLIWEGLDKPRAITLFYEESYMFWTDWGKEPKIGRAQLDGSSRTTLIDKDVIWPNGLTVDKTSKRIFWADARTEQIESVDLNGRHRKVVMKKVAHPYNVAVSGEMLYWTDWQKKAIYSARKDGQKPFDTNVILQELAGIMDIKAVHMDQKVNPLLNRCGMWNGGCSHLCLPRRSGLTCACPSGLQLLPDNVTCKTMPEEYVLFASRGSIRRISLDLPDRTDVYLPLPNLHNVIAIDYDYADRKLYYTDVMLDVIRRADLNGSHVETVVDRDLKTTDGLAVDWVAKNLYWTDTGADVIEVSWLNGKNRLTLIKDNLDQPRAIAVHPEKGYMYWTDWGYHPRIERAYLDGTNRKYIINSNLGFPNGLSIDYASDRLYWVDAKLDKIETSTLEGTNRVRLIENVPHPFGLAVFGDFVYWTDWQTQQIMRAGKYDGKHRETIKQFFVGLMDIEVVSPHRQKGTNACSKKNGGCTHLCLARPDGHSCMCPTSDVSNRTCISIPKDRGKGTSKGSEDTETGKEGNVRCSGADCQKDESEAIKNPKGAYIALASVIVIVFIGMVLIIILWKRQRRRQHYSEDFSTLTFTNPNYQRTSTETINSDRPPREWRIFRFNKRNERISVVSSSCTSEEKLNMSETEALYPQDSDNNGASCFPDRPRKTIFKQKPSDTRTSANKLSVPYKQVDKARRTS